MNITSMLSSGYLQPSFMPAPRPREPSEGGNAAALSRQEREVLAQENSLRAASAGAQVSTTYRYTLGPDGRRYVTGAEVTVQGDERTVGRVTGGVKRRTLKPEKTAVPADGTDGKRAEENSNSEVIRKLEETEREVIAHEAAHQAAAGRFGGGVSYTYTRGPDGRAYITGGEVPIHVPASSDPEETLRNMEQVQRAALAPHSPSGQDIAVAASAAASAARARQELASGAEESNGTAGTEPFKTSAASVKAGLLFERIWAEEAKEEKEETRGAASFAEKNRPDEARAAYSRVSSRFGLWALGQGFEPAAPKEGNSPYFQFDIAA
ncbi:MAG: hypothetical protein LBL51_02225 [Synergistaceae bacterium]|jgi:hypothetical protein|nr:hypothetical protein [Synergistaceae bacterium]